MEGFVKDIESADEADLAPFGDTAPEITTPDTMAPDKARRGLTGPHDDDQTIKTFRGIAFGVPVALGLWAALIGVSAYLIA